MKLFRDDDKIGREGHGGWVSSLLQHTTILSNTSSSPLPLSSSPSSSSTSSLNHTVYTHRHQHAHSYIDT